jgi:translocation and assembly module TamA
LTAAIRPFRYTAIALGVCLAASPAWAEWWPFGAKGQDYRIEIEGVDAPTLAWFTHLKLTRKTSEHPPADLAELAQEGMTLETHLNLALKAKGYYDAQIDERLDTAAHPPVLHYRIAPGPQTTLSAVRLEWQGAALPAPDLRSLHAQPGQPVDASLIESDAATLQTAIGKNACLLSLTVTPVLTLTHATHRAQLAYRVAHGPRADFGLVAIQGNQRTKDAAIRRLLAWKQGECYTAEKIAKSQSALFGSQLFSSVKITPAATVDTKGEVPVVIAVTERSPRTISAGVNYATDQGFGVKLDWEHRNIFGGGEKLNADAVIAQQEQSLSLAERIPGFWRDDQVLSLATAVKHEDTDAYTARSFGVNGGLERKIDPTLTAGAGLGYDLKRTTDLRNGTQTYSLISAPLFIDYDTRDNVQDATKGIFAHAALTPYQDMLDANLHFLKTTLTGQTYLTAATLYKPTLALRASLGSIAGSPYRELPADLRYYAGGGGSVRGYSYQSLSPHFDGDPVGGGSLVELSGELRLRFSETIGGVAFLDAGNAYASSIPRIDGKLYYGAGVGARYYSSLGPIRLDVGVPLNGGDIGQHGYALYVSLGQAF